MKVNEVIVEADRHDRKAAQINKQKDANAKKAGKIFAGQWITWVDNKLAQAKASRDTAAFAEEVTDYLNNQVEKTTRLSADNPAIKSLVSDIRNISVHFATGNLRKDKGRELVSKFTELFRTAMDSKDRGERKDEVPGLQDGGRVEFGRLHSKGDPKNKMLVRQGNKLWIFVDTKTKRVFEPASEVNSKEDFDALQHPDISYTFAPGIARVKPGGRVEISPINDTDGL